MRVKLKKKWKKDLLIILPVKNIVFHKFVVQLSSFYGVEFFLFLVRNSILFLVSHKKFKTEKNATCNDWALTVEIQFNQNKCLYFHWYLSTKLLHWILFFKVRKRKSISLLIPKNNFWVRKMSKKLSPGKRRKQNETICF